MSNTRKISSSDKSEKISEAILRILSKEFSRKYKTGDYAKMYMASHAEVALNLVRRRVRSNTKIQKTTECPPIATRNAFTALKGASEIVHSNATTNEKSDIQSTNKAGCKDTTVRPNRRKPPPIYVVLPEIKDFHDKTTIINCYSMDYYEKAIADLKSEPIQYYTYTSRFKTRSVAKTQQHEGATMEM
ncbi:hypothetical protein M0802_012696 [Mischocyttarus mexicanus]|nr:hypothetical protein M0802_012696 [Mischocyttarus mexicanus]